MVGTLEAARAYRANLDIFVNPSERFWNQVGRPTLAGCLPWEGCRYEKGYGRFGRVYAHRFAWEEAFGPIPDGLEVHHECRNKACVNALHMRLITPEEHKAIHSNEGGD